MSESVEELVLNDADLTEYAGIGTAIASAIREIVLSGTLRKLERLPYDADHVAPQVEKFLLEKCGATRAQVAGDYRRRVEVITELSFVVEAGNFPALIGKMEHYGGRTERLNSHENNALFRLPSGIMLRIERANSKNWGTVLIASTGSTKHKKLGLNFIDPELREGRDEVELARRGDLPTLVTVADIRGEPHAHTISSDGSNSIEQMAAGAQKKGYEYIGISDHSQSLKIARGVPRKTCGSRFVVYKPTGRRARFEY